MKCLLLLALLLIQGYEIIFAEKILALSFFGTKSHENAYTPLIEALANRGHSITFVHPFKSKPHKNIRDIIGVSHQDLPFMKERNMFNMKLDIKKIFDPTAMYYHFDLLCRSYYNMSEVQDLTKEKFDLILVSAMLNECTYGLIYHLKAPFILISPLSAMQSISAVTGTPSPSSFVPFLMFGSTDQMNFFQRVGNLIFQMVYQVAMDWLATYPYENVYREYLGGDTPSASEILKNVSLILSNSHPTVSYARPLMPDIIEVDGMACTPAKPLPKDLEDFISGAGKDGVIFFSMGTVLKATDMPESYRKIFVNTFSKLKQRVIWKWESEKMDDLPKNVKLGKWLPQQDILGHHNVKMFITHGGLGSTVEAVYHGIPLLGLPMFADQATNLKLSSQQGFSVTLDFTYLTEESLLEAINKILSEPRYAQRAKEMSSIYRDRPQNPLEAAVYWTEYVMRHKGAKHLRSPARDLNWIQYNSFDSVAFVIAIILLVIYLILTICRYLRRKCCSSRKGVTTSKKRN